MKNIRKMGAYLISTNTLRREIQDYIFNHINYNTWFKIIINIGHNLSRKIMNSKRIHPKDISSNVIKPNVKEGILNNIKNEKY